MTLWARTRQHIMANRMLLYLFNSLFYDNTEAWEIRTGYPNLDVKKLMSQFYHISLAHFAIDVLRY